MVLATRHCNTDTNYAPAGMARHAGCVARQLSLPSKDVGSGPELRQRACTYQVSWCRGGTGS